MLQEIKLQVQEQIKLRLILPILLQVQQSIMFLLMPLRLMMRRATLMQESHRQQL